jgi:dTDP-4-dehydrorhamnose 3,5-epimerase
VPVPVVEATDLESVLIVRPKIFRDGRGSFCETWSARDWKSAGVDFEPVQDNHSVTIQAGMVRGLHYQLEPMAQAKLVRVVRGAALDVAVDIRRGSPAFGKWVSVKLTEQDQTQVFLPRGFAHGFCSLVADTEVIYKVDRYYSPEHDRAIRWDDPDIGIDWPFDDVELSKKDRTAPLLKDAEINFTYGDI